MIIKKLITAEELWNWPDDGHSYELVRGELRMMTPAGFGHGRVAAKINILLGQHVLQYDLGVLLAAETGFALAENPDTVRAPDLAFVTKDRIPPEEDQDRFAALAPDFVVEVLSPHDQRPAVDEKVQDYLSAGVRLIWVVDPKSKTVEEHRPEAPRRIYASQDELRGHDVLPGFRCPVADFFV